MNFTKNESISIIGPTASGKTKLAVHLAEKLDSEVISIDSRQFYKGMDIGTGKDLDEFFLDETTIKHHLIDIVPAGQHLNINDFKQYFYNAYTSVIQKGKIPILCGGTGNYLLSLLKDSKYTAIPENFSLRDTLKEKTLIELQGIISTFTIPKDYYPDQSTIKRCIRIIEVLSYLLKNPVPKSMYPTIKSTIFGIAISREQRRKNISVRLKDRLKNGLIDEVKRLKFEGVPSSQLIRYGLEYKYVTMYLENQISKLEMETKLETEIHRFAKRQLTFFRKMEKDGFLIHWINYEVSLEEKINQIINILKDDYGKKMVN